MGHLQIQVLDSVNHAEAIFQLSTIQHALLFAEMEKKILLKTSAKDAQMGCLLTLTIQTVLLHHHVQKEHSGITLLAIASHALLKKTSPQSIMMDAFLAQVALQIVGQIQIQWCANIAIQLNLPKQITLPVSIALLNAEMVQLYVPDSNANYVGTTYSPIHLIIHA